MVARKARPIGRRCMTGRSRCYEVGRGGPVYGSRIAQLGLAYAQRIIGITGDGDQGLIALQAYAKEVPGAK